MGPQRNVLAALPGALVAVLAGLNVIPAVLRTHLVVRIGNRLSVLVARDDAVAVEIPVAEGVVLRVDRIGAASRALLRHVGHERVADSMARRVVSLRVI